MSDTPPETVEAIAQRLVAHYVPRLRGARTPAYTQPSLVLQVRPACSPSFAALMRLACAQVRLADAPEDVVRVLRYHRMYGMKQLYRVGMTGLYLWRRGASHEEHYREFCWGLAALVGELLLGQLGMYACAIWFPWNDVTVVPEGDRGFRVICDSLDAHLSADGRTLYASQHATPLAIRRRRLPVAFSRHTLTRLSERISVSRSYGSLGDLFDLIQTTQCYEAVALPSGQDAFAVFEVCQPGFFSQAYAESIVGTLDPAQTYVYRVGYCPVVADQGFWVAKTVLPPGFSDTPEYQAVRATSFDLGVKERFLELCAQQAYGMVCMSRDFDLLRWFHTHGVPQVQRLVNGRLARA